MPVVLQTFVLLLLSNVFMTFAWYGHLKDKSKPMMITILIAWGIAFFEYCMQVPANRIGHGVLSAPQLKAMQEAITFIVFIVFSFYYLKEKPTFYDYVGFLLIFAGVMVSLFQPRAVGI